MSTPGEIRRAPSTGRLLQIGPALRRWRFGVQHGGVDGAQRDTKVFRGHGPRWAAADVLVWRRWWLPCRAPTLP